MKILFLYNNSCALPLLKWLHQKGHQVIPTSDQITEGFCLIHKFDLAISYTYRYILTDPILRSLNYNVVNMHNSFLPWNRGADPNLWSIIDSSPRGVTLHYMDTGLDKGAIIVQQLTPLKSNDTLKTSYESLNIEAITQFQKAFEWYPYWREMCKKPVGVGSYHSKKDGDIFRGVIDSYDMTVEEFRNRIERKKG